MPSARRRGRVALRRSLVRREHPCGLAHVGSGDQHDDRHDGEDGDARLELYRHRGTEQWALVRYAFNGDSVLVRLWPPHVEPDDSLIDWLCQHDVRRGYDAHDDIVRHNERLDRYRQQDAVAELTEAGDRLAWAMNKE